MFIVKFENANSFPKHICILKLFWQIQIWISIWVFLVFCLSLQIEMILKKGMVKKEKMKVSFFVVSNFIVKSVAEFNLIRCFIMRPELRWQTWDLGKVHKTRNRFGSDKYCFGGKANEKNNKTENCLCRDCIMNYGGYGY